MKTAEQILDEVEVIPGVVLDEWQREAFAKTIHATQLEAIRAGLEAAANFCGTHVAQQNTVQSVGEAIRAIDPLTVLESV